MKKSKPRRPPRYCTARRLADKNAVAIRALEIRVAWLEGRFAAPADHGYGPDADSGGRK